MSFNKEEKRSTTDYTALVNENNGTIYNDDKLQLAFLSTDDYFDKDYLNYNFYALEKLLAGLYNNQASGEGERINHEKDDPIQSLLLDLIYPIGSIYMSTKPISPAHFLGGTWTPIQGTFLFAENDKISAGNTGGSQNTTLGIDNLPEHDHDVSIGKHSHTFTGKAHNHGTGGKTNTCFVTNDGANLYLLKDLGEYPSKNSKGIRYMASKSKGSVGEKANTGNATQEGTVGETELGKKTTEPTGKGTAFSIMPPYKAVYMWERTVDKSQP